MLGALAWALAGALFVLPVPPPPPPGVSHVLAEADATSAPGAAALTGSSWAEPDPGADSAVTREGPVVPLRFLGGYEPDLPRYYGEGCHRSRSETEVVNGCVYGDPDGDVDAWVLGDSKVGQWFPALEEIAWREGWRLVVRTKSSCPYAPSLEVRSYPECSLYNDALARSVEQDPPDLVFTGSGHIGPEFTVAYVSTWRELRTLGVEHVVALWDSHRPSLQVPACVEVFYPRGPYDDRCAYEPVRSSNETVREAAVQVPGSVHVDMIDWICPPSFAGQSCPPVIGGVVVYRDGSHLSDTYVATLTDPLHERLHRAGVTRSGPTAPGSGG